MDLNGLAVKDIEDTKIGDVIDFFFDTRTNEPEWLVVEVGLLDHKTVLVPLDGIARGDDGLKTPYPKDIVMDAPAFEGTAMDKETERALYEYYHVRRELPGRTQDQPAFEQDRSETGDARLRSWKAWKAA